MATTFLTDIISAIDSGVGDADLATACHKIQAAIGLPLADVRPSFAQSIFTRHWKELSNEERRHALTIYLTVELSLALTPPTAEIAGQRCPGNATMN